MSARYLVRLDDACPTMDAAKWRAVEELLDARGIRPLVAVVPDNRDPVLKVDAPDPRFWELVRHWQSKGWTIAMHGYQHQFHNVDRNRLLLPFYDRSEFAGLPYEAQAGKIRASWRMFKDAGVEPTAWIAPAHCFDRLTLDALRAETPIRIVSDGLARTQFFELGFYWLPQQLWSVVPKDSGLWTICLHPNTMTAAQIDDLERSLGTSAIASRLICVHDVELKKRRRSLADRAYSVWFWQRKRLINFLLRMRSGWRPSCG